MSVVSLMLALGLLGVAHGVDPELASGNNASDTMMCNASMECDLCIGSGCTFVIVDDNNNFGAICSNDYNDDNVALLVKDATLCPLAENSLSDLNSEQESPTKSPGTTTTTTSPSSTPAWSSSSSLATCSTQLSSGSNLSTLAAGLLMGVALTLVINFVLKVHRAKKQKSYTEPYSFDSFVNM